jgi:hypothetical protein
VTGHREWWQETWLMSRIVMRPRVKGEEKAGLQMPLLVKPLAA